MNEITPSAPNLPGEAVPQMEPKPIKPPFFDKLKQDSRPQRGLWAPGKYWCRCRKCPDSYIGDKRSIWCADCAYAEPVPPIHYSELARARWWASGWAQSTNIETDLAGRNISIERMAKSEWRMKKALWRLIAATKA